MVEIDSWTFDVEENDVAVGKIRGFSHEPMFLWHTALLSSVGEQDSSFGTDVLFAGYPLDILPINPEFPALVVRKGILASHPKIDISVPMKLGRRYGLIDAFSQNGFSGGPIWMTRSNPIDLTEALAQVVNQVSRGATRIQALNHLLVSEYPKHALIGINCGHFRTKSDRNDEQHAGLSYFVKIDRVCDTIKRCLELERLIPSNGVEVHNSKIDNNWSEGK